MKLRFLFIMGILLFSAGFFAADAEVYEASTLHNAVSRSETVQDLFTERWKTIMDNEQYFDFYGRLNWIPGFSINTINKRTGEKESVDMTLVRTYGSLTLAFPILGEYSGKSVEERIYGADDSGNKDGTSKKEDSSYVDADKLLLAFTATGFHYGLTSSSSIDRGTAGTETITDYRYTQFFDDIFAASLVYRPYFFIHGGVVLNNQIDPNDDGTMSYGDFSDLRIRYFVSSNILSFLNLNAATTTDRFESLAVGIIVNNLVKMVADKVNFYVPAFTVTYKNLALYNDEAWDPVWVGISRDSNGDLKTSIMTDSLKEHGTLHTISLLGHQAIIGGLSLNLFLEFQFTFSTLIEKKTQLTANPEGDEVNLSPLKEGYLSLSYDFFSDEKYNNLILEGGASYYWDISAPVHRVYGTGYGLWGGFLSLKWETAIVGFSTKVAFNDSDELRKLIEASDKFMVDVSVFCRY